MSTAMPFVNRRRRTRMYLTADPTPDAPSAIRMMPAIIVHRNKPFTPNWPMMPARLRRTRPWVRRWQSSTAERSGKNPATIAQ